MQFWAEPGGRPSSALAKVKVLFISLNYGPSLPFHLELKKQLFCLLELAKLDI